MRDFPKGIQLAENEHEYQSALDDYSGGFVLGFKKNRNGLITLHRPGCTAITYGLKNAGHFGRSRKILFRNRAEADTWLKNNPSVGPINDGCRECHPRKKLPNSTEGDKSRKKQFQQVTNSHC
jgi:hypothetical protein